MSRFPPSHLRLRSASVAAIVALAAAAPAAAEGYAVCVGIDAAAQGRVVQTAQPYAREPGQVGADAAAFGRAAASQGKAGAGLDPACHWEPTREKAADYLRRFREGAGRKGADAQSVSFTPSA